MRRFLLAVVLVSSAACGTLSGAGSGAGKSLVPVTSPAAYPTPPGCLAIIEWVDFVRYDGIFFSAASRYPSIGRPIAASELGAELARVRNTVSSTTCDPHYRPVDGDAGFVPAGEPIFAVKGYSPKFRVAARHHGGLVLYEADVNPAARHGADLLDIAGRVSSIALMDQKSGRFAVARLTDRPRVDGLVELILRGNVDQAYRQSSARPRDFVHIALELDDGTATFRAYDRTGGYLWPGIHVGDAFTTAVNELVAAAPTPTPVPPAVNLARRYDLARADRVTVKAPNATIAPDAYSVAMLAAALDSDAPAQRATRPAGTYIVLIFSFPDRIVSIAYDPASALLTVVSPDDELAVSAPARARELLPKQ